MKQPLSLLAIIISSALISACSDSNSSNSNGNNDPEKKAQLGAALYSDKNLSNDRTQSCATCHSLEHGFVDNRTDEVTGELRPVSMGDDQLSFGDRNAPTAGYAMFSPEFILDGSHTRQGASAKTGKTDKTYSGSMGGQFHDGREKDLKGQAGGPPTNPVEMAMTDKAAVVARIQDNSAYVTQFKEIYGSNIFNQDDKAYAAMAESIGEFEMTDTFATFDSKYDASVAGDTSAIPLFSKADKGRTLFFSSNLSCNSCHQLNQLSAEKETFTSYEYHNIGVPFNDKVKQLRADNNLPTVADMGLFKFTKKETDKGKFKVPTLRNIAVTGPYMHNGVFTELKTVIEFYDHFTNNTVRINNPENGLAWTAPANVPEVDQNLSSAELNANKKLTDNDIESLVCFLSTLTDKKFESKIPGEIDSEDCLFAH